ncbi:TM2 domain-containing protein 1 [Takifugu flavidus]|uniref:TM2 domain-containing protein 1 n=1 Tax=Takifugu flavidus TaxID=433684 RepID=A0A5C6MT33_9TELE|nr:TM2 domain-containing protein 1 [Takifugu flavidus]
MFNSHEPNATGHKCRSNDEAGSFTLSRYLCNDPRIDEATQEPENCRDMLAWVECLPAPNITCRVSNGTEFRFSGEEVGFNRTIPCRNVSGYSYKVAVALSLFLGWLGADRFYLGYPALGLLKFCTVGFCGVGTLIDFILIAMQVSSVCVGFC